MFNNLRRLWLHAALAFLTLGALELPVYLLLKAVPIPASNFYGVALLTCVVGLLCSLRHGKDVGHTLAQLYALDLALNFVLLGVTLAMNNSPLSPLAFWAAKTASITLNLWKVLALISMLGYPVQPGWPTVIPFAKRARDNPGDPQYDHAVYLGMALAALLAGWLAWRGADYEMAMYAVPMVILTLIVRAQHFNADSGKGQVSEMGLALGIAFDRIPDPEVRTQSGSTLVAAFRRLAERLPTPTPPDTPPADTTPLDIATSPVPPAGKQREDGA